MFITIFLILLLLIAVGCWVAAKRLTKRHVAASEEHGEETSRREADARVFGRDSYVHRPADSNDDRQLAFYLKIGSAVCVALVVLLGIFACTFRVGAKEYGVLTTYGHVDGNYPSGIHAKLPWQKAVTVDGRVKTYGFAKDTNNNSGFDKEYTCLPATLGNGPTTCVDATIRWQITEDQAGTTYANYGSTDNPTDHYGQAVIRAQFRQVVADVVRTYNPIAQLQVLKGQANAQQVANATFAPDYDTLSKTAQTAMQERVGGEAVIQSIAISAVPLDTATQQKLSQFVQEQANTRTAAQKIQTDTNLGLANKKLESSLENSPGLLIKQCLDIVEDARQSDYQLPQTFNCAVLGGGGNSSVILQAPGSK